MARYGREWGGTRGGEESRGRPGGGWSGWGGYGWRYRRRPGRWRPARHYGEYDYEFGGRGWPYEAGYEPARWEEYPRGYDEEFDRLARQRRRRALRAGRETPFERTRRFRPYHGEYPGTFGYDEDFGYAGALGEAYDEAYRGAYGETWRAGYGREYVPYEGGYGAGYGRGYTERYVQAPGIRYGTTPSSRWPEEGHDLDHPGPWEREMSDREIRDAVMENLFQDTWIDPRRIDVDVRDGVVTLRGEVRDFMEARYAWDDAWESAGVRGVVNNLTVRTDRPAEDMELPQTSGGAKYRATSRAVS